MPLRDKSAENRYREAFERLISNNPTILEKGALVTQKNVALEAGSGESAIKKSRFPILVLDIQDYISKLETESEGTKRVADNRSRTDPEKFADCRRQRDKLASIVLSQNSYIEELQDQIASLKSGKIVKLKE